MGHFLDWYSKHNTLLIQILFGVIGLLLCFLIYKIFFGAQEAVAEEGGASLKGLEDKLAQMIESSKNKSTSAGTTEAQEEVEKLRTEIYGLRQSLKEKEDQIQAASTAPVTTEAAPIAAATAGSVQDLAQIEEYKKKIEELETRLSDYEVIAEDIADLHRLREENDKLKAQIDGLGAINTAVLESKPVEVESALVSNELSNALPETDVAETTVDSPAVEATEESVQTAESVAVDTPAEDPVIAESVEEPKKEMTEQELAISELEKQLISDFEKSKG